MHFLFFFPDAILTMVNNIAANVLGGKPELEDGAQMEGVHMYFLGFSVNHGLMNYTRALTHTHCFSDNA